MPAIRTEISEIVTGLAMFGFPNVEHALGVRPDRFVGVTETEYDRLTEINHTGAEAHLFATAWRNGTQFARSVEGLRGRPPWIVEWKGSHRPPGYDQIPADLRVDHVYLLSCKYGSNILTNSSPMNLFDRLLADRQEERTDWFFEVAPAAYQEFYSVCRRLADDPSLPDDVSRLTQGHRDRLKRSLRGRLSGDALAAYRSFVPVVAEESNRRWNGELRTKGAREQMVWRLLRLQSAPYFVLGESAEGHPLAYRVGTPWDLRSHHDFLALEHWADRDRGQPVVGWRARFKEKASGRPVDVVGHVEVRWSHGRFAQVPEAKVYLDTPHHQVPGYVALERPTATDEMVLFP